MADFADMEKRRAAFFRKVLTALAASVIAAAILLALMAIALV